MKKNLLVIGAGGHGRVVADIASRIGRYNNIAFLDDTLPSKPLQYPYLGNCAKADQLIEEYEVFVAIGNADVRQRMIEHYSTLGASIATLVAPEAVVAADVKVDIGTVIMPGAIINTGTSIGKGVIVNTASSVDHDCLVEDYCHVAVGAHLCGSVCLESKTWIGAGSTVINNIHICRECMVGAGAVVIRDIEKTGMYIGVPAKRV